MHVTDVNAIRRCRRVRTMHLICVHLSTNVTRIRRSQGTHPSPRGKIQRTKNITVTFAIRQKTGITQTTFIQERPVVKKDKL